MNNSRSSLDSETAGQATLGPRAEVREAVLKLAFQQASSTRNDRSKRLLQSLGFALVGVAVLAVLQGGISTAWISGGNSRLVSLAINGGVAALFTAYLVSRERRGMMGRSRQLLGAAGLICLAGLVAPLVAGGQVPGGQGLLGEATGKSMGTGLAAILQCVVAFFVMGLALVALSARGARRGDITHPGSVGIAHGATVGAWVMLLLQLRCVGQGVGHEVLAHALPVVLLAGLTGWLRHSLCLRSRPSAKAWLAS